MLRPMLILLLPPKYDDVVKATTTLESIAIQHFVSQESRTKLPPKRILHGKFISKAVQSITHETSVVILC